MADINKMQKTLRPFCRIERFFGLCPVASRSDPHSRSELSEEPSKVLRCVQDDMNRVEERQDKLAVAYREAISTIFARSTAMTRRETRRFVAAGEDDQ